MTLRWGHKGYVLVNRTDPVSYRLLFMIACCQETNLRKWSWFSILNQGWYSEVANLKRDWVSYQYSTAYHSRLLTPKRRIWHRTPHIFPCQGPRGLFIAKQSGSKSTLWEATASWRAASLYDMHTVANHAMYMYVKVRWLAKGYSILNVYVRIRTYKYAFT